MGQAGEVGEEGEEGLDVDLEPPRSPSRSDLTAHRTRPCCESSAGRRSSRPSLDMARRARRAKLTS
eukprot:2616941-Pyramimonas_sp.AAC.1